MLLSIGLIVACTLLISVVLMQNSSGGLRGQTVKQIAGIKKAGVFAEKATWTLAIFVMLFSMMS